MKIAISVPDTLFRDAEELIRGSRVSRSEFYSRALRDYVARHTTDAVTDAYDAVQASIEDPPEERAFQDEAARRVLESAEW